MPTMKISYTIKVVQIIETADVMKAVDGNIGHKNFVCHEDCTGHDGHKSHI